MTRESDPRSDWPVTDGLHLYFIEGTTAFSGSGIAQVSAVGGETTQLQTTLREPSAIYGIPPDFSELLVANGASGRSNPATGGLRDIREVWAQPLPARTPLRVGNIYAISRLLHTGRNAYPLRGRGLVDQNQSRRQAILASWRKSLPS